jgi:hypothetical protein
MKKRKRYLMPQKDIDKLVEFAKEKKSSYSAVLEEALRLYFELCSWRFKRGE